MRFHNGFWMFAAFLIASATAQTIESHFYSSPSDCGASSPSNWYYSFVSGDCYLNQTVLGVTSCEDDFGCLEQQLDFVDYQACLASAANGTLASFGGSFELSVVDGQIVRTQYSSDNCLGTSDDLEVLDRCDLNTCSGDVRRNQWFPQTSEESGSFPIPVGTGSADDDDEDDTDSATTGEIVGISLGFGTFGVILFCSLCCCISFLFFICFGMCVVIVVLLAVAMVYYRKHHTKSKDKNDGNEPESRYQTEAAPSDIELDDGDVDSEVDPLSDDDF